MISFEKFKENIIGNIYNRMNNIKMRLDRGIENNAAREGVEKALVDCKNYLENIDSYAISQAKASIDGIIFAIRREYNKNVVSYYSNYEALIRDNVIARNSDGSLKDGVFPGQIYCAQLGITVEDLMLYKNMNPLSQEFAEAIQNDLSARLGIVESEEIKR